MTNPPKPRTASNPSRYVYIMHEPLSTGRSLVKVGISDNPERRLRENTTGSPYDLVLRSSFDCGEERIARDVEKETHRTFREQQTKARTGEWLSADVEAIEECVVALVREHCLYDPLADERVLEQRREYLSSMGIETDEGDELFEVDEGTVQRGLRMGRRKSLSKLLPKEAEDASFIDWYSSQWKPFECSVGIERLNKGTLQKIINIDALINAMDSDECFEEWEMDERACRETITQEAIKMWRAYKSSRRLTKKELKLLFRQMDGFVKTWDERSSDRNEQLPSYSIVGRRFYNFDGPKPKDQICIQLGLGIEIYVRLNIPADELTEPNAERLKIGGRRFCFSHIAEAWVDGWAGYQSVDRHQAGVQIREIALETFLKSRCEHCFRPYLPSGNTHGESFLSVLHQAIAVEQKELGAASSKTRALFASHKDTLISDAGYLIMRAWRLYRGDKRLESEIQTGEFDLVTESNLEELDVFNLLRTMITGISSAGDQLCRDRQIFPDVYYDVYG